MADFKFPDETENTATEDAVDFEIEGEGEDIEVVDDTPEADRGRTPMAEPPADVTDEELEKYSESVKKRIQHFSKGYHEERRAKEAALREREEALRFANKLVEENKKLQGSLGQGQQALLEQAKKVVANEVEQARQKLKEAHEAFDTEAIIAAQEELTSAKIRAERVNNFRPAPLQEERPAVQPAPIPQVQPDTKALAWQKANPWFGSNRRMTAVAMEVHNELVRSGVSPTSDTYYAQINAEVRKVFPDAFPSEKPSKSKGGIVAPATRSTAPKKIVLTQTAVNLAKRLGLTPEQYARAAADVMRNQND